MNKLAIATQAPISLDLHKYMRKSRRGKIRTAAMSKSRIAVNLTVLILFGLTVYGYLTFD
jgi:hypothetical protein